jgi:hypothetical protein
MFRSILTASALLLLTACTGTATMVGAKGERGATGPTGAMGPAATSAAVTGATGGGEVGIIGPQGATGSPGADGSPGTPGAPGAPGSTGPMGPTGVQGPQGIPGTAAMQGLPGVTGAQGPAGTPGATGAQGPQGVTGPAGATGATGATGPGGDFVRFVSGSRLTAVRRTFTGDDGSIWGEWLGFHDNDRNVDCAPMRAEDGKMRCLPRTDLMVSFYKDGFCGLPLAYDSTGLASAAPWALEKLTIPGKQAEGYRAHAVVAPRSYASTMSTGVPGSCTSTSGYSTWSYYTTSGYVHPTYWVAFN